MVFWAATSDNCVVYSPFFNLVWQISGGEKKQHREHRWERMLAMQALSTRSSILTSFNSCQLGRTAHTQCSFQALPTLKHKFKTHQLQYESKNVQVRSQTGDAQNQRHCSQESNISSHGGREMERGIGGASAGASSSGVPSALYSVAPLMALAEAAGYSQASYYTSLGLFLLSLPGVWSLVKRATKSKVGFFSPETVQLHPPTMQNGFIFL